MPTILTHPAVPLAIGLGLGSKIIPRPLLVAGVVASMLPDLDVVAYKFGIPYSSVYSHRGFTHSIEVALAIAIVGALAARHLKATATTSFLFIFAAALSHGLLDSFTNGGSPIAFLWPFSDERFFAPWRFIEVSPIGIGPLFSARGVRVLLSELLWVWMPAVILGFLLSIASMRYAQTTRRKGPQPGPKKASPPPAAKKLAAPPGRCATWRRQSGPAIRRSQTGGANQKRSAGEVSVSRNSKRVTASLRRARPLWLAAFCEPCCFAANRGFRHRPW
jgi:inner membrane protein